jgi:acyl-CoA thioester hydrolase
MPTFVETYRSTVAPSDCDHLGHMNVQHYFAAVSDGMFTLMLQLGLGPEEIRKRQISFAVVRAETDFHRELRAGDIVALESTVLKVGEKSATFQHRLKNVATGTIAMNTEFKCVLLDLERRQATLVPEDIRAAAAKLIGDHHRP